MTDSDIDQSSDDPDDCQPIKKRKKISSDIEGLIHKAYNYYLDKNYAQAIEVAMDAIKKSGGDIIDPYFTLYQCYISSGKEEEALLVDVIINNLKHNNKPEKWVECAQKAESKELYEWAYKCYTKALKLNKDDKALQKKRALCSLKVNKPSMGKSRYLNIMRKKVLVGNISEEYFYDAIEIANIYSAWKKFDISEEILYNAYRFLKKPSLALQLMITYNEDSKFDRCVEFYTMNVNQIKKCDIFIDIKCQHTIAMIKCNKTIPSEEKYYEFLLKDITEKQVLVCSKIGDSLHSIKKYKNALLFYMKVKEIKPQSTIIFPNIILCYRYVLQSLA